MKKEFKETSAPKGPLLGFFLFCSEYHHDQRRTSWPTPCQETGRDVNNTAADGRQPYEKKAAKLKGICEKDIAAYRAKEKPDTAKKGVIKAEKSKKTKE
ncbi:LOW QUALITY PROTEIN: High mobility group protein B1 [Plecturocebus cupreus]